MTPQHFLWPNFLKSIKHEVVPALGCTEPISLALASAIAARHLGVAPERIVARVPDDWLAHDARFASPADRRAAYVAWFAARLAAPRTFVTEAVHAQHV